MPGQAQSWNSLTRFQPWQRKVWALSTMAWPSYLQEGTIVPTLEEASFTAGLVWTCMEKRKISCPVGV